MSKAIDKEYLLAQFKNFFKIKLSDVETTDNKITSIGSSPTDKQYPSAKAVKDYIDTLPEPMVFKGSLGTEGTITFLPAAAASNEGFTYKVITAGTYQGIAADVGDTFISDGTTWVHIPSGDEPSGTVTNVAAEGSNGIQVTGGPITDSGIFKISGINATQSSSGMMSAADKKKLDNLSEEPGGYLLPTASATTKGGIKVGNNLSMEGEVLNAKDTTYSDATQSTSGLMSAEDKNKLDGIEDNANNYTHPDSAVIPGIYKSVTVDSKGHITAGSNPTTLAGYGITDGALSSDLSSHIKNTSNPHKVTKAQVGLDNVENKSSATIRGELTKSNVTTALGYTPYTPNEIDNKLSALETNIDWKESVATYDDIATTYLNPIDGWTVNVKDTDYTYRYNGTSWVAISANAIPKATNSVDGLLSKEDHTKYEDANSKKHTHSNKSVIDGISSTNVSNWNNAQANVIETVKVNGTALIPSSKAVDVAVPTKVSDLTNDAGYTANKGTITEIKMNGTSKGTSGVVDLGTVITSHQDISGKSDVGHKHTKSEITDFPTSMTPTAHNQASNTINAMTGYSKPTSTSAILTSDTLNTAIGKLEKALDSKGSSNFSGSYNDLSDKPTIPTVGNGTVTIKQAGVSKGTFTMNQSGNTTIELTDNNTTYGVATSSALGLIKSGTDITIDSSGNVSVNNNSHSHTVSNISDLTATASELNVLDGITATTTELNYVDGVTSNIQTQLNSKSASGHTHDDRYYTESEINTKLNTKLDTSLKGSASGLAELDANGKVPASQLPSYVDDVLEYSAKSNFPTTGETGKIYVDTSTNLTYRWSGTAYVEISPSLALGETSSTAYRGDRGKIAYDHSQSTHARTDATNVAKSSTNGNIKINGTETTVYTHPSGTNPHGTTKSDVGLGNVGNFKAVSTVASQGLTDTEKSNARANIGAGTSSFSGSYNDLSDKPTIPSVGNGTITITQNGTTKGTFTTNQSGNTTIALTDNNTTYGVATSSALGLVKSGTDITVDSSGNVSVNDDSHNHVISNVDGLQSALDGKAPSSHTHNLLSVKPENYKQGNDLPSTYPRGETIFLSDNPTNRFNNVPYCTIHTIKGYSNMACIQFLYPYNTNPDTIYYRTAVYNSDSWRSWQTISVSGHTHNYAGSSSAGGSANSAVKLDTSAGSTTQPIYFKDGKPTACSYTLGKSVPSNAVFTDTNTHYASGTIVNNSTTATSNTTSALTNGNVYLNHIENGAVKNSHKISGSGATTVTSDASGNIVISSTDTNTTYSSKSAASGGTDVSLVTTGEKYNWNNKGTYSKPSGGIPKSDLASTVQTSLGKADTALQSYTEKYTGTITGIKMNGVSKGTSGVVDLGTVITAHQDISGKLNKTGGLMTGTLYNEAEIIHVDSNGNALSKLASSDGGRIGQVIAGNSTSISATGGAKGALIIYGEGTNYASINANNISGSDKSFTLPNKEGTLALKSDTHSFAVKVITFKSQSFSASSTTAVTASTGLTTGQQYLGIVGYNYGSAWFTCSQMTQADGTITLRLKNNNSSAITAAPVVHILYATTN